jgi:hypothetical protein
MPLEKLIGMGREAEEIEQSGGVSAGAVGIDLPEAGDEIEIFERGQAVVDHGFVGDPGKQALGGDGIARHVLAENFDGATVGREEAGDGAQDRCLASAVWAKEGVELAGSDRQVEIADDRLGETFGEAADGEGRDGHVYSRLNCRAAYLAALAA